jgi:hypothetical protein
MGRSGTISEFCLFSSLAALCGVSCCVVSYRADGGIGKSAYSGLSSGLRTRERRDSTQSRLAPLRRLTIGSFPGRRKREIFGARTSRLQKAEAQRKSSNPMPPRAIPSQHQNLRRHNQQLKKEILQQTQLKTKTNPPSTETTTSTSTAPEPQRNSKSSSPSPLAQPSRTPSAAAPSLNSLRSTSYEVRSTRRSRKNKTINSC